MANEESDSSVVVFSSSNYMEAHFIASVLNGSDISAFVLDDNVCRIYPWAAMLVGGANVLVRAQDLQRSREVLAGVGVEDSPMSGQLLSIPLSEPAIVITLLRRWLKKRE